MRGGQGPPNTPEMKFPIWPSSGPDQYKFILWYKLSFLWKVQQDWSTLKGGFDWSGILWHPRHLHSLNLHFGLDMHFWRNTLLKFIQVATPVGHNMVYNLKPAFTEKISAYPEPASWGCIFGFLDPISHIWHHWYTRCNPENLCNRIQWVAGDFWAKFHGYRAIFSTGLGWFTSILDHFNSIIRVKYFLFRHVMLQMCLKYPPLLLKQAWN